MLGKTFHDFKIVKKIGEGNMGEVYLATQLSLERLVALKIIEDTSAGVHSRFQREAKSAAAVQHPNIVNIFMVGHQENFSYIAMEYVEGSSLEEMIKNEALQEEMIWRVALQICKGLQAALKAGIIHRDIKPGNILLTTENVAKLADFGLSKKINDQNHLTHNGVILGTPNYMSPEQASGREIDFRSDIYSLGASIYQAITGNLLFTGKSVFDVLFKHKMEPAVHPQEYVSHLKKETSFILAKMLNKNPDDRYQSYGDLTADITALLQEKSLPFADANDAVSVYQYNPNIKKEGGGFTKLVQSIYGFFSSSSKIMSASSSRIKPNQLNSIILVSGLSMERMQKHLQKYNSICLHLVSALPELVRHLKIQSSLVILDSNYLGPSYCKFSQHLKARISSIAHFYTRPFRYSYTKSQ